MNTVKKFLCFFIICSVASQSCSEKNESKAPGKKYVPVSIALYAEIFKMDSLMFDAFNRHNADSLMQFFSSDLEFYHDKGGLEGYEGTFQNFISLFEKNKTSGLRRDLIKESLEVFPIQDFGAIETCLHRFCHKENGKDDCGTFKNIMIWKKTGETWKVTRVLSYDH